MIMAFYAEEQLIDWKRSYGSIAGIFAHFPSAVYAVVVWIVNFHFRKLAVVLTEWGKKNSKCDLQQNIDQHCFSGNIQNVSKLI